MRARTPPPWHAVTVNECTVRAGRTTLFYGSAGNLNWESDAAFVVQACNAHADLVAALRALVAAVQMGAEHDTLEDGLDTLLALGDTIDQARAALAKAGAT